VRQAERPLAQAGAVSLAARAGFGDVPNRVGARIAIGGRILGAADADRIEDDEKRARHSTPCPGGGGSKLRSRRGVG
jgi:hypothetical protein